VRGLKSFEGEEHSYSNGDPKNCRVDGSEKLEVNKMFLTREEVIINKLKKLGEAIVGGFLIALPFLLVMILWTLGF